MEASHFALRILECPDLAGKLTAPDGILQDSALELVVPERAARESRIAIVSAREAPVPKIRGWSEINLRRRILHALANHELQAVELYAKALAQFPKTPADFISMIFSIVVSSPSLFTSSMDIQAPFLAAISYLYVQRP